MQLAYGEKAARLLKLAMLPPTSTRCHDNPADIAENVKVHGGGKSGSGSESVKLRDAMTRDIYRYQLSSPKARKARFKELEMERSEVRTRERMLLLLTARKNMFFEIIGEAKGKMDIWRREEE